jgi:hypothetical protein
MHEWGWGRAEETETTRLRRTCGQKRGVPRHHVYMPPGNSFPQICVVSVDKNAEIWVTTQEYLRVVTKSNLYSTYFVAL